MIISIQSSVLYGHVGNQAALPIYHACGHNTAHLDTVRLAAHPGFGTSAKACLSADDLQNILADYVTLKERPAILALHIGYIGHADQIAPLAALITTLCQTQKDANMPTPLIIIDPVFGDGNHSYVSDEIIRQTITHLLPLADVITPNQFELSVLSGDKAETCEAAIAALQALPNVTARYRCLTGFIDKENKLYDSLWQDGESYHHPQDIHHGVSGAGDAFAALWVSHFLKGHDAISSLQIASDITHHMIAKSKSPLTLNLASGLLKISQ